MKVIIFGGAYIGDLEKELNEYLAKVNEEKIISIEYAMDETFGSAMVILRD